MPPCSDRDASTVSSPSPSLRERGGPIVSPPSSTPARTRPGSREWTAGTKSELEGTLRIGMGGLAAEEIWFGEAGTGPSGDLAAATNVAAQMVGSFGVGRSLVSYEAVSHRGYAGGPNVVAKVLSDSD